MIGNGIRIHHHVETVESADQAVSLVNYLTNHGMLAFQDSPDAVMITMECPTEEIAADNERRCHMLVSTWHLFWEHTDQGVFDLPIYRV